MKLSRTTFWVIFLINAVLFVVCAILQFPCMGGYLVAAAYIFFAYKEDKWSASGMRCFFASIGKPEKYATFCICVSTIFFILGTAGLMMEIFWDWIQKYSNNLDFYGYIRTTLCCKKLLAKHWDCYRNLKGD